MENSSGGPSGSGEAWDAFVSRINRELRTPLNTIVGFSELLAGSTLAAEQREWVSQIVISARRMGTLMDDSRDFSQMEARELTLSIEPVAVGKVAADAVELIAPLAASHGVHVEPPPESPCLCRPTSSGCARCC